MQRNVCDVPGCGKDAAFMIRFFDNEMEKLGLTDDSTDWHDDMWAELDDGKEVCSSKCAEELHTSLILRIKAGPPKPKPRKRSR
jgi:hypothetical protein